MLKYKSINKDNEWTKLLNINIIIGYVIIMLAECGIEKNNSEQLLTDFDS